jgi:ribonuclease P protein component
VRRRLRAALREHAPGLQPGAGYLVRATHGAGQASYSDLSRALRAILDELSGADA